MPLQYTRLAIINAGRRAYRSKHSLEVKMHHAASCACLCMQRLTCRDEGVLDCIALGDVAQSIIDALDDDSI